LKTNISYKIDALFNNTLSLKKIQELINIKMIGDINYQLNQKNEHQQGKSKSSISIIFYKKYQASLQLSIQ